MTRRKSLSGDDRSSSGAPDSGNTAGSQTLSVDKPSHGQPCLIIGIGASAGAQEALEQIFTAIPPDCCISFVVIMHIPLAGPSFLAEMLGRYSTMPVVTAEEGMALLPDRVQVIPAGYGIVVREGVLRLEEPEAHGVRHPIDRFFETLALESKHNAVAVLLSGSGTDGTKGVKAIRDAGGTVIVQEPGSAMYPDMPRSAIATGAVEYILPADEIAGKIAEIAGRICPINPPDCRVMSFADELAAIFGIVKTRTGHDFSGYKMNTVMRRIERRMAVNELSGIRKYLTYLEETPQEPQALAQDILIGVTGFFRDPEAFETIERVVIPRLFDGRDPDEPVRIWHACCATGEEVYSMAFLIREYLDRHGSSAKVQIFATDIDETSIAQARAGLYPEGIEGEVGEERLKSFFTRSDKRWQVVKQVREMIVFAHHSVIKNPPFSRLDLLVCRNFLIYLNPDMQNRLISVFHQVLRPGKVLFLGSSETAGRNSEMFTIIDKKWKIFERTAGKHRGDVLFPFSTPVRYLSGSTHSPKLIETVERGPVAVAERLLMERYSPPCVIVNEKYEVVHVTSRLNRFLEVPLGEPSRDILRMAREDLRPPLRAAIHKAFAENRRIEFRGVKVDVDGAETAVNLLVEPLEAAHSGKLAMVILEAVSFQAMAATQTGGEEPVSGDEASGDMLIRQLEEQLRITHEQLHATTEQLESSNESFLSANEELISMNEEFQSANEELQSTNEELETSKEELQALNEELATVNFELHEKVEEVNQANSDMENLLASSGIATLFLDLQLNIKGFTPAMAAIFNLIPADIGRPFRHLAGTIDWSGLPQDAASILENLVPIEREVTAVGDGKCFIMRVLPYRGSGGGCEGVVVTLIDITERKRMEEQTVHLASFPELNPNPVLEVDSAGMVIFANPATKLILESLGMGREDFGVFLPSDLDEILRNWDRKSEATLYREINVRSRVYGESIFLTPQFNVARIYAFDITERKQAQEALAESEQRVRRKLDSIISPEGDIGNLDLGDIIDAPSLQLLVDDFYELTRMPMGLLDLKGKVLVGVGWQDVCTKFHRVHPEACRNCLESDVHLSAGVSHGEYKIYKCKNNMWDVATPVMVGDRKFGNLFMGQFFFEDEPLDYELFRSQARQYGFDEEAYIAALEAVPRLSRETLNGSMSFFIKLADLISKLSYSNIKLARSLSERDALMESLREREEQLRLFIRHSPAALAMFDTDMRYLSVSRRWLSDYDLDGRDLIGESHYDVFPEVSAEWREAHRRGLAGEVVRSDGERFERADGSVQWLRWEIRPWKDAAGNIGGIVIFADDITELRKAEEILRRYELLAGHSRDIILFLRRDDGTILEANSAAANAYGYDHGELLGMTVKELRAPESLDLTAAQMAEADTRGILFESVHRRRDGSTFPVEVSSQGATIDGTRTLISVIRDISKRKRAEDALRGSEERLKRAQEIAHLGSWELDLVNNRLSWSDEVYRIFGLKPQEFDATYKAFLEVVHPDDRAAVDAAYSGSLREGRDSYEIEHRVVRNSSGEVRNVQEKCEHFRDESGRIVRSVGMVHDITERKMAEEMIRRQSAIVQGINQIFEAALASSSEEELGETCLAVAEEITGSRFGFIGEIGKDGLLHNIALSNPGWELCTMYNQSGERRPPGNFHIHGVYGMVLTENRGFFTNEPASHPASIGVPEGHPPLTAFLGVPLRTDSRALGMIAVGNRDGGYSDEELLVLEALAPAIVEAFQRKKAEELIRRHLEELRENNEELTRFNSASVGREMRMIELKKEINALCEKSGQQPRYPLDFVEE